MGIAKSIVSVAIIGNAKNLIGAINKADASMGGLLKTAAKGFVAFKAVDATFDFLQGSSKEADRLGDAMARLDRHLSPELVARATESADQFTKIGASRQDILELSAVFVDFGAAVGVADNTLAVFATQAAATAQAMALIDDNGRDSSAILDLITKAAGGSIKAAKELGVALIDTKDPAAQLNNVLMQLKPILDDAVTGTGDLEQKQAEMQARIENLQGKIGEQLNPVLLSMLTIITDGIEDIDGAIWGFQRLGQEIEKFARMVLGPLGNVADAINAINSAVNGARGNPGFDLNDVQRRSSTQNVNDWQERNGTATIRRKVGTVYD
jgi:hypothetical protein